MGIQPGKRRHLAQDESRLRPPIASDFVVADSPSNPQARQRRHRRLVLWNHFPPRLTVFDHLCRSGIKSLYACGLYGPLRDSLISRAKIILNLNFYDACRIFESVRVSYLLANEKAVVSDIYPDSIIDPDLKEAVAWAPLPKIAEECARLLKDDTARRALAARGRAIIERRDIRANLQRVLGA